jgi:hypothetical protein
MQRKSILTLFSLFALAIASSRSEATIISSESFEGKTVGSLSGQGGGVGWANSWTAESGINVSQGGLNYSNGNVSVFGGDRKLSLNSPADGLAFSRQFAQSTTGTTYMSMLFQAGSVPDRSQDTIFMLVNNDLLSDVSSGFRMTPSDSANRAFVSGHAILGGGFSYSTGGGEVIQGATNLLVARLYVSPIGTERVDFWFNPSSLDEASNTASTINTTAISGFTRSFLMFGTFGLNQSGPDEYFMDEIKIGSTWSDVVAVPEPSSILLVFATGFVACLVSSNYLGANKKPLHTAATQDVVQR